MSSAPILVPYFFLAKVNTCGICFPSLLRHVIGVLKREGDPVHVRLRGVGKVGGIDKGKSQALDML